MTDINNIVETQKTEDEIKKEKQEKLKEYRRNYYRNYYKNNEYQRNKHNKQTSISKTKRYEEDAEFREKAIDYSKFYKFQKKVEINEKLAKLEMLEKILGNNIDFQNSKISVKA
tara:strand:+ start:1906 stop:2247 length:342 start_codon:yes stop_codon:yes gene_type:complete